MNQPDVERMMDQAGRVPTLEAEIERLTAERDDLRKYGANEPVITHLKAEVKQANARVEKLESERKRDCVAFFQWWWNQPGSNTAQGYDEWIAATEQEPPKENSQQCKCTKDDPWECSGVPGNPCECVCHGL